MGKTARRLYYVLGRRMDYTSSSSGCVAVRVRVSAHQHLYCGGPYRSSTPLVPSGQVGLTTLTLADLSTVRCENGHGQMAQCECTLKHSGMSVLCTGQCWFLHCILLIFCTGEIYVGTVTLKTGILYCVKHSGMSTVHCTVFSFALQLLNFLNES